MTDQSRQLRPTQHPVRYRSGRARVHPPVVSEYGRTLGVLDIDGLHVAGRQLAPCPAPESLGDAYGIAAWHELGALWITPRLAEIMGLPPDIDGLDGPIDAGVEDRWATLDPVIARNVPRDAPLRADPGPGRIAPWINVYDPTHRQATIVNVVFPHLDKRTSWHRAADGDTLLRALLAFRRQLGTDYYWSTNATASTVVRNSTRTLLQPCAAITHRQVPPALTYRRPIPAQWTRPLTSIEDGGLGLVVAEYDTIAAHLAPIGSADLGIGEPEHIDTRGPIAYGPRPKPGYYRLERIPQWPAWCRPYLPPLEIDPDDPWIPAPLVAFLTVDLQTELDIREAYVWRRHGRPYEGFYERCRTARESWWMLRDTDPAADLAYRANAAMYKSFWGYLARTTYEAPPEGQEMRLRDLLYRPDHAHTIDTLSSCNMLRRVLRIGRTSARWPIGLQNDAAYYVVNDPYDDVPGGMTVGTLGGQFTAEREMFLGAIRPHIGEPTFIRQFRKDARKLTKGAE